MTEQPGTERGPGAAIAAGLGSLGRAGSRALTTHLGGVERTRVILLLAAVLALSSADAATVGASATELRSALHISNTDIGLLVTVTSLVAALASIPFGVLADRVRRTWTLAGAIVLWGVAMIWSATVPSFDRLLLTRLFLGAVTAAAGPFVASLVGDYFGASERGRIYGYILAGELAGAGIGFALTGNLATLSWRAAFVVLALPAFVLAWLVFRMPEPARGGSDVLLPPGGLPEHEDDSHTDAQRLAHAAAIEPDPELVLTRDPRELGVLAATKYILRIRTNSALILASACGYYFLGGVQTFGVEFVGLQYDIGHAVSTLLLLVIGIGGVGGVLAGGAVGDFLLRRGYLNGRITTAAFAAVAATILFVPALFTGSALSALLYIVVAVFMLSAQSPPLAAARLDIMVPLLWGRAEGVRTLLRTLAQAFAPLLFGAVSDHVFGGGRTGLQWTFV